MNLHSEHPPMPLCDHDECPPSHCLERLVRQLLDEARYRKRRVATRLWDLRGDWLHCPVRGPILPNGRPSTGWMFYQRAVANHRAAADQVKALLRVLPNSEVSNSRDNP